MGQAESTPVKKERVTGEVQDWENPRKTFMAWGLGCCSPGRALPSMQGSSVPSIRSTDKYSMPKFQYFLSVAYRV